MRSTGGCRGPCDDTVGDIAQEDPEQVDQPDQTVQGTHEQVEGGESASGTVVSVQAGENVRFDTDTTSDDGDVTVESVDLEFAEDGASVNVRVTTTSTPPDGAPGPDGGETGNTIGYVETTVSGSVVTESDVAGSAFTFRVSRSRLDRTDTSPENVRLYRVADGTPSALETEHLGGTRVRAVAPGFSVFVIGTAPAEFRLSPGTLDRTSVERGETFRATVQVQNIGGESGDTTLTLEADGDSLTSDTVTLGSSESITVNLSASIDQTGTYAITVDGNAVGTLDVTEPESRSTTEATPTASPERSIEESEQGTPTAGTTSTSTDAPGFGLIVALLALLGVTLLALRRRHRSGR
jgi:PGF-CTERM protein/PGF-pre-PGF domain-containing protein